MKYKLALLLIASVVVVGSVVLDDSNIKDNNREIEVEESELENKNSSEDIEPDRSSPPQRKQEVDLNITGEYPTEERYINKYYSDSPRRWIPKSEADIDLENPETSIYEVTRYPNAEPTEQHLDAAWELYNRSFEAAKEQGWFEYEQAIEDGFDLDVDGIHDMKIEHMVDNETLNPNRPEFLIYYPNPQDNSKKMLAGYMYEKDFGSYEEGEQVGGPLTVWHYHPTTLRREANFDLDSPFESAVNKRDEYSSVEEFFRTENLNYTGGEDYVKENNKTPEMLHVWFARHPEGPFGTRMGIPPSNLKGIKKMNQSEFNHRVKKHSQDSRSG